MRGRRDPQPSLFYAIDVEDRIRPDHPLRPIKTAVDRYKGIDIIVNNAGFTWDNVIQKMTDEQWYAIMDVHVTAPFRILRAFAPYLREQFEAESKRGQRVVRKVVQISSTSSVRGNAGR